MKHDVEAVQALLAAGAKPDVKNNKGAPLPPHVRLPRPRRPFSLLPAVPPLNRGAHLGLVPLYLLVADEPGRQCLRLLMKSGKQ